MVMDAETRAALECVVGWAKAESGVNPSAGLYWGKLEMTYDEIAAALQALLDGEKGGDCASGVIPERPPVEALGLTPSEREVVREELRILGMLKYVLENGPNHNCQSCRNTVASILAWCVDLIRLNQWMN